MKNIMIWWNSENSYTINFSILIIILIISGIFIHIGYIDYIIGFKWKAYISWIMSVLMIFIALHQYNIFFNKLKYLFYKLYTEESNL
jgi:hypothetical protein